MFALGVGGNIFMLCSAKQSFVEEQMFVQLLKIFAAFHVITLHTCGLHTRLALVPVVTSGFSANVI